MLENIYDSGEYRIEPYLSWPKLSSPVNTATGTGKHLVNTSIVNKNSYVEYTIVGRGLSEKVVRMSYLWETQDSVSWTLDTMAITSTKS